MALSRAVSACGSSFHHFAQTVTRMLRAGCAHSSAQSRAYPVSSGFSSILPSVDATLHVGLASACLQGLPVIIRSIIKLASGAPIVRIRIRIIYH